MKRAKTRAFANLRTGGLLAIERKFCDWAHGVSTLATGGTGVATTLDSTWAPAVVGPDVFRSAVGKIYSPVAPVALNVLGPGDTGSDRDGRQVINDSVHLRGACTYADGFSVSALDASCTINIVLVLDTQNNGGAPTGGLVFVNPGDFTAVGADCGGNPFVNLSNSKRFRILKHIRRVLLPSSQLGTVAANQSTGAFLWSMDVPLKGMKTNYVTDTLNNTGAATSSSIGDNGIYLFAWCNAASTANITYSSRLRFRG